jgi:large repetitive protein
VAAGVPWRRAWLLLAVVAVAVAGVVVAVRAEGFAAVDATVPRATRWFLHEPTGRAVLVDGFSGRSLARIEGAEEGQVLQVVQSASGVALVDRSAATVRIIDGSAMRLGPEQNVPLVTEPRTVIGFGQTGIVAVDPATSEAVLVPPDAEPVPFIVSQPVSADTRISPDGAIWSLADGALVRATSNGTETPVRGLGGAQFSLVGNDALLLDTDRRRMRFGDGDWLALPGDADASEFVVQQAGPAADCGWIGANDALFCVGDSGVDATVDIPGLDIEGSDLLAIAGDAGVVVRPGLGRIDRIDWRAGRLLGGRDEVPSAPPGADLVVSASVDLVWVDDVSGELVWAIHPWGFEAIAKNDADSPLLGESGDTIDNGQSNGEGEATGGLGADVEQAQEVEPDDNGIDDPPEAADDQVTSRFGVGVPIVVTANDFDPDGEAIAVSAVTNGARGEVTIVSATTVMYSPQVGTVGTDEFEYTIVDGNGTEDTATVTVQLLPVDAPNQAPVGTRDRVETSRGTPVIIDVLLNDVDPERDQLRVGSFVEPIRGGTVGFTEGPTDLPALEYRPPPDLTGPVRFQYVPIDSFGAEGSPVDVVVDIAADDENRQPLARPDALRIRRDVPGRLPVLANDVDPDGDRLVLGLVRNSVPDGLEVEPDGNELAIVVRPGAPDLMTFEYTVSDGRGEAVIGRVLVTVIPDTEPNRPPVANADTETAVVGEPVLLDVLRNDSDPDEDPITLISIDQPDEGAIGTVTIRGRQIEYLAGRVDAEDAVFDRFTYTITDGRSNFGIGEVTVRVLPERVKAPPFARDDAATTEVDEPVVIDVLRNDGDPSGESPTLLGDPGCAGGGTATVTSDAQIRFVPPAGRTGSFTCSYQVRNSQGLTARASIVVNVVPVPLINQPPTVNDSTRTVDVDETITIDLLADASDPDGDTLRVSSITPAPDGRTERAGDTIVYTAPSEPTTTIVSFTVSDGQGGTALGRITIRVLPKPPADEPPNAATDRRSITGGGIAVPVAVLGNDSDSDGDSTKLVVTHAELVTTGAATVSYDAGTVTITPRADFVGDIVVTYEITDEDGLTDTAEVLLTVQPIPNRAPIARDDADSVVNGGTIVVPIAFNDEDPDGDALTYRLVSGATSDLGVARLDASSLVFDAEPGQAGTATIGYSVSDGQLSESALVRITVLPCSAAPPSAPDVSLRTGYMQPIAIDLAEYAANGQIVEVGPPLNGPSGIYNPPAGENGNVSFSYTVRNSCRIQDSGVVVIDVNQDPVGTAREYPIGRNATLSIQVEALATDLEPLTIIEIPGAPEWITIAGGGTSLAVVPGGRAGRADFTAIVVDPGGLSVSVPVSVTLVNLEPIANPDTFQGTNSALLLDILANDSDPDPADTVALQSVPAAVTFANGVTVPLEVVGGDRIRLVPGAASGLATFTYTIVDSQGLPSQPATVTVSVNSPPIAPTVDITVVADGTPQQFPVLATDPDGQQLVLEVLDQAAQLQITVDGLNLTIVAGNGAIQNSFALRYRVTDPFGLSAEGVLNINAIPPTTTTPPPPSTQPVEVTMQANDATTVTIPAADPQGGVPVITIPDNPTPLDITIDGLDVTIDAPRRAGGNTYELTYVATTPSGGVATNTLTVTVQQNN